MSNLDVIRAWKDEEYRFSLSEAQLQSLPENPAGMIDSADSSSSPVFPTFYTCFLCPHTLMESCITICIDPLEDSVERIIN